MKKQRKKIQNGSCRPVFAKKQRNIPYTWKNLVLESLEPRQMFSTAPLLADLPSPESAEDGAATIEAALLPGDTFLTADPHSIINPLFKPSGDRQHSNISPIQTPTNGDRSVIGYQPNSMRPKANSFRRCLPIDLSNARNGVIEGKTVGKSLEHGPGLYDVNRCFANNLWHEAIPDDGPTYIAEAAIDSEDGPNITMKRPEQFLGMHDAIWTDGTMTNITSVSESPIRRMLSS